MTIERGYPFHLFSTYRTRAPLNWQGHVHYNIVAVYVYVLAKAFFTGPLQHLYRQHWDLACMYSNFMIYSLLYTIILDATIQLRS